MGKAFNQTLLDWIAPNAYHDDGNRLGCLLNSPNPRAPSCYHDNINFEAHQLGGEVRGAILLPLRIPELDGDILSFWIAKLAQGETNPLRPGRLTSWIARR